MTVSYRFGGVCADVVVHGATLRAEAASLGADGRAHQDRQAHKALARGHKLQTAAGNVAGTGSAVGSSRG